MGFFSSLFSSSKDDKGQQKKAARKNFDILKNDNIRAQRVGKPEYVSECFAEALKIQEDLETMKRLLSVCYTLNMYDQALEALNGMVASGKDPVNALLMRASLLFSMEKRSEAAADCERIIEIESDHLLAYYLLAKSEANPLKAIEHIDKVTGIKTDYAAGYALRAEINLALEKGADALLDVGKVIALTPDDEAVYLLRGRIYELLGKADAALQDYRRASELNPSNEEAYLLIGRLLMSQGKYDEAIPLFDEALEHNEKFAKAYAARSFAKRQTGDLEGALADEEKSRELDPDEKINPVEKNYDGMGKRRIK